MVTSTVSLARAESFSMAGGIAASRVGASWFCAPCARITGDTSTSSSNSSSIFFMGLLLILSLLGLACIDFVDPRLGELQLAACDAEGQHQALLRGFSLGALSPHAVEMDA